MEHIYELTPESLKETIDVFDNTPHDGGGGGGGGGGTDNYNALTNKPKINGITLEGDKTYRQLGIASRAQVGDMTTLETEHKDTLVEAINDVAKGSIELMTADDIDALWA